jgi:hypothetical protein
MKKQPKQDKGPSERLPNPELREIVEHPDSVWGHVHADVARDLLETRAHLWPLFKAVEAWIDCTDPKTAVVVGGRVADYRNAHKLAQKALAAYKRTR